MPPMTRVGTVRVLGDVLVEEGYKVMIGDQDLMVRIEAMEQTISDLTSQVEALSNVD